MSDYIDTRKGWREVDKNASFPQGGLIEFGTNGNVRRQWVREEPGPPLPTEPYTVIDADLGAEGDRYVLVRMADGERVHAATGYVIGSDRITGFEVLAEPHTPEWVKALVQHQVEDARRKTAKAVLDRVRGIVGVPFGSKGWYEQVAREFGVES
jgi:hypothetical protein